jgi:periplasmic divalent cation tolerance protein
MTDKIVVFSACDSEEEAEKIARLLIETKLAACVNVFKGVHSFYRWKGAIQNTAEWLLIIKSSRTHFEALRAEIEKVHSYDVPELIAMPIVDGSKNYLSWLENELRD